MILAAKQRSDLLRALYRLDMSIFIGLSDFLVFVDETGADRRDCIRRHAYSLRGRPATARKFTFRGDRVNAIISSRRRGEGV